MVDLGPLEALKNQQLNDVLKFAQGGVSKIEIAFSKTAEGAKEAFSKLGDSAAMTNAIEKAQLALSASSGLPPVTEVASAVRPDVPDLTGGKGLGGPNI